jgi:tetratricopeptide (TPR) repeat protein
MDWTLHGRYRSALGLGAAAITLVPFAPAQTGMQMLAQTAPQALPQTIQSTSSASPSPQNLSNKLPVEATSQPAAPQGNQTALVQGPQPAPEQLGDILAARQRYQAAIEAYQKAPQDSASVWNKMGIAYQMMYDLADATRCYLASLKIDPRNASVLNNLGTTYDALKQYPDAEKMYKRALKIEPRSAVTLKNLGTSEMAEHNYRQGWKSYQAALAIDPHIFEERQGPTVGNPTTAQNRGAMNFYMAKTCVRAGMNDRAIEFLRLALNEGFTNPKKINADREFSVLQGIPAFEQLLAAQSKQ